MTEDKAKILEEKIQYLISMSLTEKNFEVISVYSDISTYTPKTTGSELDKASADIAEQQRMESAADAGNQTTNSSVTNNSNSSGKEPTPQIVDVYDTEFAKLLAA
jgi:hypothetical protein